MSRGRKQARDAVNTATPRTSLSRRRRRRRSPSHEDNLVRDSPSPPTRHHGSCPRQHEVEEDDEGNGASLTQAVRALVANSSAIHVSPSLPPPSLMPSAASGHAGQNLEMQECSSRSPWQLRFSHLAQLKAALTCPLCDELLLDNPAAVETCGHCFCYDCINSVLEVGCDPVGQRWPWCDYLVSGQRSLTGGNINNNNSEWDREGEARKESRLGGTRCGCSSSAISPLKACSTRVKSERKTTRGKTSLGNHDGDAIHTEDEYKGTSETPVASTTERQMRAVTTRTTTATVKGNRRMCFTCPVCLGPAHKWMLARVPLLRDVCASLAEQLPDLQAVLDNLHEPVALAEEEAAACSANATSYAVVSSSNTKEEEEKEENGECGDYAQVQAIVTVISSTSLTSAPSVIEVKKEDMESETTINTREEEEEETAAAAAAAELVATTVKVDDLLPPCEATASSTIAAFASTTEVAEYVGGELITSYTTSPVTTTPHHASSNSTGVNKNVTKITAPSWVSSNSIVFAETPLTLDLFPSPRTLAARTVLTEDNEMQQQQPQHYLSMQEAYIVAKQQRSCVSSGLLGASDTCTSIVLLGVEEGENEKQEKPEAYPISAGSEIKRVGQPERHMKEEEGHLPPVMTTAMQTSSSGTTLLLGAVTAGGSLMAPSPLLPPHSIVALGSVTPQPPSLPLPSSSTLTAPRSAMGGCSDQVDDTVARSLHFASTPPPPPPLTSLSSSFASSEAQVVALVDTSFIAAHRAAHSRTDLSNVVGLGTSDQGLKDDAASANPGGGISSTANISALLEIAKDALGLRMIDDTQRRAAYSPVREAAQRGTRDVADVLAISGAASTSEGRHIAQEIAVAEMSKGVSARCVVIIRRFPSDSLPLISFSLGHFVSASGSSSSDARGDVGGDGTLDHTTHEQRQQQEAMEVTTKKAAMPSTSKGRLRATTLTPALAAALVQGRWCLDWHWLRASVAAHTLLLRDAHVVARYAARGWVPFGDGISTVTTTTTTATNKMVGKAQEYETTVTHNGFEDVVQRLLSCKKGDDSGGTGGCDARVTRLPGQWMREGFAFLLLPDHLLDVIADMVLSRPDESHRDREAAYQLRPSPTAESSIRGGDSSVFVAGHTASSWRRFILSAGATALELSLPLFHALMLYAVHSMIAEGSSKEEAVTLAGFLFQQERENEEEEEGGADVHVQAGKGDDEDSKLPTSHWIHLDSVRNRADDVGEAEERGGVVTFQEALPRHVLLLYDNSRVKVLIRQWRQRRQQHEAKEMVQGTPRYVSDAALHERILVALQYFVEGVVAILKSCLVVCPLPPQKEDEDRASLSSSSSTPQPSSSSAVSMMNGEVRAAAWLLKNIAANRRNAGRRPGDASGSATTPGTAEKERTFAKKKGKRQRDGGGTCEQSEKDEEVHGSPLTDKPGTAPTAAKTVSAVMSSPPHPHSHPHTVGLFQSLLYSNTP